MSSLPAPISSKEPPVWGWVRVRALVVDSVASANSRRVYAKALDDFWDWCQSSAAAGFTRETVQRYRAHLEVRGLAPSSVNLRLTVLRKLAHEAAANGILPHEVAASITGIKGTRQKGVRLGAWLTLEQAQALLKAPRGNSPRARRDRALLALLVGCGLRRNELAQLDVDRIQQREGRWVIVDVAGKGKRIRSVPMPAWAKTAIDAWTSAAEIEKGRLFRAISQKGDFGEGLTAQAVYLIVKGYAEELGIKVAPHDLRRTFAKLAHRGRSPLEQIQLSLGHESILTTERYLGVRQSLSDAPCDHLGIDLGNEVENP
jgi:site-specific recombinase XerD